MVVFLIVLAVVIVIALLLTVGLGAFIFNFVINRESPIHMSRISKRSDDDLLLRSGSGGTAEDWEWFKTGERISIRA